jgi:hypothetical protein
VHALIVVQNMHQSIPISLKIVAWLFIISGVSAAIEVLVSLMNNHINLNFGVLGIFIGIGLLNLRDGWRICGLVFIWIALILVPIVFLIMLSSSGPLDFSLFGQKVGYVSKGVIIIPGLLLYALLLWERWVLSRSDIKVLFQNN